VIPVHLKGRDLLRDDWNPDEVRAVLDLADFLKARQRQRVPHRHLEGRTLAMVFDKPSTRTRVSFAVAMAQLGGSALTFARDELQLGRGETVRDTALVLSGYVDGIVIRTFAQSLVEELAAHASVPVLNGLTDDFHPCQALSDLMTIREQLGEIGGARVAYVGDGNSNVCHSLLVSAARLGAHVVVASPSVYAPRPDVVDAAKAAAAESGGSVELVVEPIQAARGADVLYTDVWTSMGQEEQRETRLRDLNGYAVDASLLSLASERAIVMHCLPAHVGEEITEDVLYGERSAVWQQAENRLHVQKALLALVIR
jgi:ornithine carbamoyltransferase